MSFAKSIIRIEGFLRIQLLENLPTIVLSKISSHQSTLNEMLEFNCDLALLVSYEGIFVVKENARRNRVIVCHLSLTINKGISIRCREEFSYRSSDHECVGHRVKGVIGI